MTTVRRLKKVIGKRARVDWGKVNEGERLHKTLILEGLQIKRYQTLSPAYGRRARLLDDDSRLVTLRKEY